MTAPISAMLERVEAASGPVSDGEWRTLYRAAIGSPDSITFQHFLAAIEGSLDHAIAFTEAAVPGWKINMQINLGGLTSCSVFNGRDVCPSGTIAPTPALALVLAALKAYQEKTP